MVEIKINRSKSDIKFEGDEPTICAELMMAYNKIVGVMADQREQSFETTQLEMFQLLARTRKDAKDLMDLLNQLNHDGDK